jgi:multicomponent Na+:H+ antiporter subunit B
VIERHESVLVTTFARTMVPLGQLFALYVLAHGHYSPGGGFQGGVIIAATYILLGLALGREALRGFAGDERRLLATAAAGILLYTLTGVVGLLGGAAFLDYAALPLPVSPVKARYYGILLIETGVTLGVAATLMLVFHRLAARDETGP